MCSFFIKKKLGEGNIIKFWDDCLVSKLNFQNWFSSLYGFENPSINVKEIRDQQNLRWNLNVGETT